MLLEIQQAILSLRDAEEFVDSQRLNLTRATGGLRLAEGGYREGINTEVEVTDARALNFHYFFVFGFEQFVNMVHMFFGNFVHFLFCFVPLILGDGFFF